MSQFLENRNGLSQEEVAEKIGSTVISCKWEKMENLPDILKCEALADLYDVS